MSGRRGGIPKPNQRRELVRTINLIYRVYGLQIFQYFSYDAWWSWNEVDDKIADYTQCYNPYNMLKVF